jgi:transposase
VKLLGEDASEQLEYVPASFRVIRYVRPKFTCSFVDVALHTDFVLNALERALRARRPE